MRKTTTTMRTIVLFSTLSISSLFACTQTEALDKMMAISRVQYAMATESSNDNEEKELTKMLRSLTADMQDVDDNYMKKEDYSQACTQYDKIFEKYNLDINKTSKDMLTMEDLKKDGGKKGGSCSLSEASKNMMSTIQKMQMLMENADIAMEEFLQFNSEHEKILPLMTTNPSKYCDELDLLKEKFIKE